VSPENKNQRCRTTHINDTVEVNIEMMTKTKLTHICANVFFPETGNICQLYKTGITPIKKNCAA
jgi:hypothetical protein